MYALRLIIAFFPLLVSCQAKEQSNSDHVGAEDTVGRKYVTDEIAGSAYIDSAISYFVINHGDTSVFTPIFIKYKDKQQLNLNLNLPYFGDQLTYNQILFELKIILHSASQEFDFQHLSGCNIGRLILTGDLAVEVTNEFIQRTENKNIEIEQDEKIRMFLKESKLVDDFNELFAPYSLSIDDIYIENTIFTTRDELEILSNLQSKSSNIPDKILDALIGLKLKFK